MLSPTTLEFIRKSAEAHGARAVWLFGSSLHEGTDARDIDLGVEGVPPLQFIDLYARLMFGLDHPVDLVDMDAPSPLAHLIRHDGRVIYERA